MAYLVTKVMTNAELIATVRAALSEATEGEWAVSPYMAANAEETAQVDAPGYCVADCYESKRPLADAALIALLRNVAADLCDRLARADEWLAWESLLRP